MKKLVLIVVLILIVVGVLFVVKPELFKKVSNEPNNTATTPEQTIAQDLLSQEAKLVSKVKLTREQKKLYEEGVAAFAKKAGVLAVEKEKKRTELTNAKSPDVDKVVAKYEAQISDAYGESLTKFYATLSKEQNTKLNEFYAEQAKK